MSINFGDTLDTKPSQVNASGVFSLPYSAAEWSHHGDVLKTCQSRFYFSPRNTTWVDFFQNKIFDPRGPPARTTFPSRPCSELRVPI